MTSQAFPSHAAARFAAAYPLRPASFSHGLVGHPLLELDAIASLAQRLDPASVEYNKAKLPIGISQDATPSNGLSIADTIR